MTKQELEAWLEAHHYPQLVLAENDVVRHCEWPAVLLETDKRIEQALAKIEAFVARVEREKERDESNRH